MASSIPGILLSKIGSKASGVTSLKDNPVPPVKMTRLLSCECSMVLFLMISISSGMISYLLISTLLSSSFLMIAFPALSSF